MLPSIPTDLDVVCHLECAQQFIPHCHYITAKQGTALAKFEAPVLDCNYPVHGGFNAIIPITIKNIWFIKVLGHQQFGCPQQYGKKNEICARRQGTPNFVRSSNCIIMVQFQLLTQEFNILPHTLLMANTEGKP